MFQWLEVGGSFIVMKLSILVELTSSEHGSRMNKVCLSVFGGVHHYLRSCRPDPTAEVLACLTENCDVVLDNFETLAQARIWIDNENSFCINIYPYCPVLLLRVRSFSLVCFTKYHHIFMNWSAKIPQFMQNKHIHFCNGHLEEMLVASSQSWLHKWERFDDSSTTTLTCWNLNSWGNGNSCGPWQSCFACLEKIERCPKNHEVIHVNLHVFMELQFLPTCAWTQRLQMNINSPKFLSGCFKYFLQIIWLLARLWLRSTAWSTIRATLTSHCNRSLPHCQPSLPSGLHHGGFPTDTFGLQRSDVVVPFLCGIPPAIQKQVVHWESCCVHRVSQSA